MNDATSSLLTDAAAPSLKSRQKLVLKALDYAYEAAIEGVGPFESAKKLADYYSKRLETKDKAVQSLIRMQIAKASTSGFVTGLGGIITIPVTLPANVVSVALIQVRMATAIAYLNGFDPREDRVKTLVYLTLCGSAAGETIKTILKETGVKISLGLLRKVPGSLILAINRQIGFRLITKFGATGTINLSKAIPIVSGAVCATFDGVTTRMIGMYAVQFFSTPDVDTTPLENLPSTGSN
jgi:hypothetical protein